MVPLANRPFLERVLGWLRRHGIREVILALSNFPEMIRGHFGDGRAWGMNLQYLVEETPLGSGGAIKNAERLLGGETFLVLNGDILTDLNLERMIEFHHCRNAQMTISLARVEDPSAYGVVEMEADGRVRRFVEKPSPEEAPSNYINAGAWLFEPAMLAKMPPAGKPFSVEREFWPASLQEVVAMFGYAEELSLGPLGRDGGRLWRPSHYWIDIGTVERYLQAHRDLLAGRIEVEFEGIEIASEVWIGEGVRLDPGARLSPPVIIGAGARIGSAAEVCESVVGPCSVVEANAVVRESVLWEEVQIGAGAQITKSVVGARQKIAPNTVLNGAALEDYGAPPPEE